MSQERYITSAQARALLGISHVTMAKLLREGTLAWEWSPLDTRVKLVKRSDVEALAVKRPELRYQELQALHTEAVCRVAQQPTPRRWREVAGVQPDLGHFNLIDDATGLPRPIRSREDLEMYLPAHPADE